MRKLAHGFTLIELLVVISIIGILATLIAANLNSARSRARDAERKSDLKGISTALNLYFNDKSTYPDNGQIPFGGSFMSGSTTYMDKVPNDPLSPDQTYQYVSLNGGLGYTLSACLENSSDAQGVPSVGISCTSGTMFQIKQSN